METRELLDEARSLLIKGDKEKSIDLFTRAIKSGGASSVTYLSRGVAHLQLGKLDRAIEDFDMAIVMKAENPRAFYYRGTALMLKKNFLRAIHDFNRTLELEPRYGLAYAARGSCYFEMGLHDEAARDFKDALVAAQVSGQRFVDSMGMIRTQLDKAFHLWIGEARDPRITPEEYEQLRSFMDVGWED